MKPSASHIADVLCSDGVLVIPSFVDAGSLAAMQRSFRAMLGQQKWNDVPGYEQTERFRHMVQDVLLLDQSFMDLALDPIIRAALADYIGPAYQLCEAKGWLSLPTRKDFHGWHGDAWYDQSLVVQVQREVKMAVYLTDVASGAFQYVTGSHQRQHPRTFDATEIVAADADLVLTATGAAGTIVLFDTSGIHRQSTPILEPRQAVFFNYHDPGIPLQDEDVAYNRYHPLHLNAALLGGLDEECRRVLGFGDKRNFMPGFVRSSPDRRFHRMIQGIHGIRVAARDSMEPLTRRWRNLRMVFSR